MDEQKLLLEIVERWNPNPDPEYREFRCANCQQYNLEDGAWHHLLNSGDFLNPVHFCDGCEAKFKNSSLEITGPKTEVDIRNFSQIPENLRQIVSLWPKDSKVVKKQIECDNCGSLLQEGYHTWFNMNGTLIEMHFDKDCGKQLVLRRV